MKEDKAMGGPAVKYTFPHRRSKLIGAMAAAAIAIPLGVSRAGASEPTQQLVVAEAVEKASGEGVIKDVNAEERKLQIAHGPIPALQWPAMTMAFSVAPDIDISGIKPGAKVKFTLDRDAKGLWVIKEIHKVE
jgi:Cu/Ag efflux protein CusF